MRQCPVCGCMALSCERRVFILWIRSLSVPGNCGGTARFGRVEPAGTLGGAIWEGGARKVTVEENAGGAEPKEVGVAWLSEFVMMLRAM